MWQPSIEDGTTGRECEHRGKFTFTSPKQVGGLGSRPAGRSVARAGEEALCALL
jgi:hypothetical protein